MCQTNSEIVPKFGPTQIILRTAGFSPGIDPKSIGLQLHSCCLFPKMRLVDTATIQLHEFFDDQIPPYAILSHRWETNEVTFQDLVEGRVAGYGKTNGRGAGGGEMKGYKKIKECCRRAREDGFEFVVCLFSSKRDIIDLIATVDRLLLHQQNQQC
jgi:hypothetical protein